MPRDPGGTRDTGWALAELGLFLRRWLADPAAIGAVAPSSRALARRMAREVVLADGRAVVELGPGTGAVTRALIAAGVPEADLVLVERDAGLHAHLAARFPGATAIRGDAAELDTLLPAGLAGRVSTVVSSLPLVNFPAGRRDAIVEAAFAVLAPGGRFVQYTYGPFSPLPRRRLGLAGRKVAVAAANLPPATVWRYTRARPAA